MLEDPACRRAGQKGKDAVHHRFHADQMARDTTEVYGPYVAALVILTLVGNISVMSIVFRTTRRVELADTDMAGIVHFANFFRFMESAEVDFLRASGPVGDDALGGRPPRAFRAAPRRAISRNPLATRTCWTSK